MTIQNDNGRNDGPIDDAIETVEDAFSSEDEELSLVEDDGPLPWLESDYDDEEEGVDTGRIIGLGLLALLCSRLFWVPCTSSATAVLTLNWWLTAALSKRPMVR